MRTRAECRGEPVVAGAADDAAVGTAAAALGMQAESLTPEWYHGARPCGIRESAGLPGYVAAVFISVGSD